MDLNIDENIDVTKITPQVLDDLERLNTQLELKVNSNKEVLHTLRIKYEEYVRRQAQLNRSQGQITIW